MSSSLPHTTARDGSENLAILLREPFRAMTALVHERLAQRGFGDVRPAHGTVFEFLDDEGTRVSVLAERSRMTKQSMAELVGHLERHGYVERVADPSDRRAQLVRTTARGREVFAVVRELVAELEGHVDRGLGPTRVRELRSLLEALQDTVNAFPD